jgi:hypothetical protein
MEVEMLNPLLWSEPELKAYRDKHYPMPNEPGHPSNAAARRVLANLTKETADELVIKAGEPQEPVALTAHVYPSEAVLLKVLVDRLVADDDSGMSAEEALGFILSVGMEELAAKRSDEDE